MEALYYREQLSANDVFKKLHTQMFSKSALQYFINTHSNMFKKGALGLSSKFHTQIFLENAHSNVSQNFTLKCFLQMHTQFFHKKKHTHLLCLKKIHEKRGWITDHVFVQLCNLGQMISQNIAQHHRTSVHGMICWQERMYVCERNQGKNTRGNRERKRMGKGHRRSSDHQVS